MIQAICRVLLHSLWQGLLFTIITGFVMLYTKRRRAAVRYRILSRLFFLFLTVCLSTLLWELSAGPGGWETGWGDESGKTVSGPLLSIIHQFSGYCRSNASLIVLGWFVIFLAKCVRMTAGMVYTQRVRHYGAAEAPDRWKEKLQAFCRDLGIEKTVLLLESRIVRMPMVIGHLKPVIFIPMGLLTGLPVEEVEAVLLHELAHIRRHDYFVNFLQHVAENVFFFNPGLLWISSLLREERENCCDDIAIAHTNDKLVFVRALVSFKEQLDRRKGVAVAFPSGRHQLLQRVLRIAHNRNKALNSREKLFFLGSCLLASALLLSIHGPVQPPREYQDALPEEKTMAVESVRQRVVLGSKPLTGLEWMGVAGGAVEQTGSEAAESEKKEGNDETPVGADEVTEAQMKEMQAEREQAQAQLDKVQAERDLVQAKIDQEQAMRDQEQALRDQEMSRQDQQEALRNKEQAEKDQRLEQMDRQKAERQRARAKLDAAVMKIRIE